MQSETALDFSLTEVGPELARLTALVNELTVDVISLNELNAHYRAMASGHNNRADAWERLYNDGKSDIERLDRIIAGLRESWRACEVERAAYKKTAEAHQRGNFCGHCASCDSCGGKGSRSYSEDGFDPGTWFGHTQKSVVDLCTECDGKGRVTR